ncbi:uncharacterized protein BYT42DRAFT_542091 [Radiomyces spectabilis]|uniref:uncharacterized protein n=1 Tax=Radiomyces spectabilis TaxID=64574 RepID=UPI00221F59A8|nr:uncharacterized protein BYT42DRAFT_542091 [Radiomyces spectabilis]KAI8393899.1 hypothetical protein BYT42DRAFT_542091 [Radiomyces spectabilis]
MHTAHPDDKRSAHNALERQRREILNMKLQQLAHALPALQTVRRPSKTMIVAKSLDFVTGSGQREDKYVNQILELRKENERLRKQARAHSQSFEKTPANSISSPKAPSMATTLSTKDTDFSPPATPDTLSDANSERRNSSISEINEAINGSSSSAADTSMLPFNPSTTVPDLFLNDSNWVMMELTMENTVDDMSCANPYMTPSALFMPDFDMYNGRDLGAQTSVTPSNISDPLLFSPYQISETAEGKHHEFA